MRTPEMVVAVMMVGDASNDNGDDGDAERM